MNSTGHDTTDGGLPRHLSVSAIVITFNPDLSTFATMLAVLCPQVERVVIVDNGSAQQTVNALGELAARHACRLKALGANLGIATAQNRGVETVEAIAGTAVADTQYVIFLDHDSIPASDMVQRLLDADARARGRCERVGGVGPVTVDKRTGTPARFMRAGRFWIGRHACESDCSEMPVDFLISSGTLTRLDALKDVGGMNDGLFIDHVDTDWCLRALARGYRLYAACDARLMHSLGDDVVEVWSGRWREVFVHAPVRDYYVFRNTVLLLRHVSMTFAWRAFLSVRLLMFLAFFGFGVPPRSKRLQLMMKGLVDGLKGRTGKLE